MMNRVDTKHPDFLDTEADWTLMEDSLSERLVKKKGTTYLPKTTGQEMFELKYPELTSPYIAYQERASFPEVTPKAIAGMVGIAHREKGIVEHSSRFDIDNITTDGGSIHELARRCTRAVIKDGRIGLLVDLDASGESYIATYEAISVINWKTKVIDGKEILVMVVLEEKVTSPDDKYGHDSVSQYRVLELINNVYTTTVYNENGAVIEEATALAANQKPLDYIPFIVPGSIDTTIKIDEIPLLPMARSAIKSYRLDADYQQSLHMTSEATAVISGESSEQIDTIGASVLIRLEKDGKAFFLEVSGDGLAAQRTAISDETALQQKYSAEIGNHTGQESGEALSIRMFSQHATLYSSVNSVGQALTRCLKWAHDMEGQSIDEASYTPNKDFTTSKIDPQILTAMNALANAGHIPRTFIFQAFRDANYTDLDDEQIEALIVDTSMG